jgi:hypothetical protein
VLAVVRRRWSRWEEIVAVAGERWWRTKRAVGKEGGHREEEEGRR